jgi:WD40 repeat protein
MLRFRLLLLASTLAVAFALADEQPKDGPEKPAQEPEAAVVPGKIALALDPGAHTGFIQQVLFTPDGKQLVSSASDNTIRIWDGRTGQHLRMVRYPGGRGVFALSPDGHTLAVSFDYRQGEKFTHAIALMALADGRIERLLRGHTGTVRALAYSADGKRLVSSSANRTLCLWNLTPGAGKDEPEQVIPTDKVVFGLALSPDGNRVVEARDGDIPAVRDLASGKAIALNPASGMPKGAAPPVARALTWWGPTTVAWSPDGKTIATGSEEGLWVWEPNGKLRRKVLGRSWAVSVAFCKDSRRLLVTSWSNPDRGWIFDVWTFRQEREFSQLFPHLGALSPDGTRAAIVGDARNGTSAIVLWKTATGERIRQMGAPARFAGANIAVGWSADGQSISWRKARDEKVKSSEAAPTSFDLGQLGLRDKPLAGADLRGPVLKQGPYVLKVGPDAPVQILKGGKPLPVKLRTKESLTKGPHHTLLGKDRAALSAFSQVAIIDLDTGKTLRTFWHTGEVQSVAPSPDGRHLLTLAADRILRIWDPNEKEALLLSLVVFGSDWILWTPQGYYAATPGGEKLMGWVVDHGIDQAPSFYPAERFRKHFYRPDVIKLVLKGGFSAAFQEANAQIGITDDRPAELEQLLPPRATLEMVGESGPRVTVKVTAQPAVKSQPVQGLRLLLDGRSVPGDYSKTVGTGEKAEAKWDLALPPGKHELKVLVRGPDTADVSNAVVVRTDVPEDQKPILYCLPVGINYDWGGKVEGLALKAAQNDARQLLTALKDNCTGKGNRFRAVEGKPLLGQEATRAEILKGLREIRKGARPGDLVVVFFACHGVAEKGGFFLLSADADPADIAKTALPGSALREALKDMPCQVLLIFDACQSGAALAKFTPATDELGRSLSDDDAAVTVLAAAMAHEKALEKEGNGLFTRAFREALAHGFFDPDEGVMHVVHVYGKVIDLVRKESNGKQNPVLLAPWTMPPLILRAVHEKEAP